MPADDPKRPDIDEIRKAGESAVVLLNDWDAQPIETLSTR